MGKVIALVGLCGAGKTIVSDYLVEKKNCSYVRFGQLTIDEIKRRGLELNAANEKFVREDLRKLHGMGAFALLNIPKLEEGSKDGYVVADGLYSWTEYKILKEKFGDNLVVIAIYASPKTRYSRIARRDNSDDPQQRNRKFTETEARQRDYAEIENIEKGGPIAYADFLVHNEGNLKEAENQVESIWGEIHDTN